VTRKPCCSPKPRRAASGPVVGQPRHIEILLNEVDSGVRMQEQVVDQILAVEPVPAPFQVASQFNLLEMTGPSVTPEHGVARYAHDPTQGPARLGRGHRHRYDRTGARLGGVPAAAHRRRVRVRATVTELEQAWSYFERPDLHKLSAVDALSFVQMTERRIRIAFAFDSHFATAGFRMVG